MPCYHPVVASYKDFTNPATGKKPVAFKGSYQNYVNYYRTCASEMGYEGDINKLHIPILKDEFLVPCRQCIGCRLERSRQWAVRCMHEATLYEKNCFITLTFNDDFLNKDKTLVKSDFQLFMKRLRRRFGDGIRYYHCGEYGSIEQRPHHHACVFNHDFQDKKLWSVRNGVRLYVSEELQSLWSDPETGRPYGFCTVGDVTFESAAYVARYINKKITGIMADEHYHGRLPEYNTMSRRQGIARKWFEKYKDDVFPHDYVVMKNGRKVKPPKYYDGLYELTNPNEYVKVKDARMRTASEHSNDNTINRLADKEIVKLAQVGKLVRVVE